VLKENKLREQAEGANPVQRSFNQSQRTTSNGNLYNHLADLVEQSLPRLPPQSHLEKQQCPSLRTLEPDLIPPVCNPRRAMSLAYISFILAVALVVAVKKATSHIYPNLNHGRNIPTTPS